MKHYVTRIAKETSDRPTDYEFQKTAIQRGLLKTQKDLQRFQRIEAGVIGENRLWEWLDEFGLKHWVCLRNVWLKDYNDFECDFILITRHCVYLFEIKNYFGKFVYENGQCFSRGFPIAYNPINQAHNAAVHLRNITTSFSKTIPVKSVLVFIGEHNHVEIKDEIDYIDILRSNEVYQYIQEIIEEERRSQPMIEIPKLIQHYEKYEIEKPYLPVPYSREEMKKAVPGIFCAQCSQPLKLTRTNDLPCRCGFEEFRESTIIRTACEYGMLTFGANFTVRDIWDFLGGQISISNLKKILCKHFTPVEETKVLTFHNFGRPSSFLSDVFAFQSPNLFRYL